MTDQTQIMTRGCPADDISAYIDGELDIVRESEMDAHFASCQICSFEMNQQKQFLCGLSASLKQERDIELPANFTRLIVANAESTVSGLRRPRERFNAMFICAGLALFVLFASGAEAGKVFEGVFNVLEQTAVVGGFFGHLIYSVFVGVVIVARSFATQFRFDLVMTVAMAGLFAASLLFISRKILRMYRA